MEVNASPATRALTWAHVRGVGVRSVASTDARVGDDVTRACVRARVCDAKTTTTRRRRHTHACVYLTRARHRHIGGSTRAAGWCGNYNCATMTDGVKMRSSMRVRGVLERGFAVAIVGVACGARVVAAQGGGVHVHEQSNLGRRR